jgi:hypothetical protein
MLTDALDEYPGCFIATVWLAHHVNRRMDNREFVRAFWNVVDGKKYAAVAKGAAVCAPEMVGQWPAAVQAVADVFSNNLPHLLSEAVEATGLPEVSVKCILLIGAVEGVGVYYSDRDEWETMTFVKYESSRVPAGGLTVPEPPDMQTILRDALARHLGVFLPTHWLGAHVHRQLGTREFRGAFWGALTQMHWKPIFGARAVCPENMTREWPAAVAAVAACFTDDRARLLAELVDQTGLAEVSVKAILACRAVDLDVHYGEGGDWSRMGFVLPKATRRASYAVDGRLQYPL